LNKYAVAVVSNLGMLLFVAAVVKIVRFFSVAMSYPVAIAIVLGALAGGILLVRRLR